MKQTALRLRGTATVLALSATAGLGACGPALSTQQEAQLGAEYATQINQQLPIVRDAAVNYYINQLGNSIAQRVDPHGFTYRFFVVNAPEVNAFALPGGYIYINRGLIERADNLAELAGVLGHEIGHVVERHSAEQISKAQGANTLAALVYGVLLNRQPGTLEQVGLQVGGSAVFAGFSREAEREADRVAVDYMLRSGINPQGIPSFHQELLAERQRSPSRLEQFFSTHPLSEERVQNTRQVIASIPAARLRGLTTDTREFQEFKARVRQLPAAPQARR